MRSFRFPVLAAVTILSACDESAGKKVAGKYVGTLSGDTLGGSRSIIELRDDGGVRWSLATEKASFAVRGETVFVDLASGHPMVPLIIRGDSLIWRDQLRTYGIWQRADR